MRLAVVLVCVKRFAGEDKTDEEHRLFMLNALSNAPDGKRGASFVAAMALVNASGKVRTYFGRDYGSIACESRGTPVNQLPFCSIYMSKSS